MNDILVKKGKQFIITEASDRFIFSESIPRYVKDSMHKDQIWLDAGAHKGNFSINYAEYVKHIFAYEPYKPNFELLKANLELNDIKNVTPYNLGLWTKHAGEAIYSLKEIGSHSSGLYKKKRSKYSEHIPVQLDNYHDMIKLHNVNCLKIDTEGGEFELLMELDTSKFESIFVEYHAPIYDDYKMVKYNELISKLKSESKLVKASKSYWQGCALIFIHNE